MIPALTLAARRRRAPERGEKGTGREEREFVIAGMCRRFGGLLGGERRKRARAVKRER